MSLSNILCDLQFESSDAKSVLGDCITARNQFYWHPLGFIMSKLAEQGDRKLRLHIWPKDGGRPQEPAWPIHDHIFDLKSWVLAGRISNVEYRASPDGEEFQLYTASYKNGKSILNRCAEKIRIEETRKSEYCRGEEYIIEAGLFHQSLRMGSDIAITLCETVDRSASSPRVVGRTDGQATYYYSRDRVDAADMAQIMAEF